MRHLVMPILIVLVSLIAGCGGDNGSSSSAFTVAVTGDAPYGKPFDDTREFDKNPAYIAAINGDKDVSFAMHAGDIHSGSQYCTQAYDLSISNQWSAFDVPLIYTPGDNEWTDCHKKKEGGGEYDATTGSIVYVTDPTSGDYVDYAGGDPVANLSLVRNIFFSTPGTTSGKAMSVHSQAQEYEPNYPSDSAFVENVWFEKSGVLFVTVNIPGGSNNGTDIWYKTPDMSPIQAQEIDNRTHAALRWLDTAFQHANDDGDQAVVIMVQADMWDLDGNLMADNHLSQYKQYIDKLVTLTQSFGKPVLLINGDSHFYRSDNPLVRNAECKIEKPSSPIGTMSTATETCLDSVTSGALNADGIIPDGPTYADPYLIAQDPMTGTYIPTFDVPNFHRLVVHGNATVADTDMEYIKLTYDPSVTGTDVTETDGVGSFGPFSWKRVQPTLP